MVIRHSTKSMTTLPYQYMPDSKAVGGFKKNHDKNNCAVKVKDITFKFRKCERKNTEISSYRDDVGVVETEEECDLGGELALQLGGKRSVLLWLADHFDGHLAACVPAGVNAAVAA